MRKICFITGSRAEYGLLSSIMQQIKLSSESCLQVIATNMHLSPEFGLTYKEIEKDGFVIDKKVEMLLSSDTPNGITKSVGLATLGFADAYEDLQPDLIVVLGDRYEILSAVSAALFYKIPIAHIHGGEITEGAFDNSIRHAITKMSHLHFTSTEEHRNRVIQMGEQPSQVFNVGAVGVDNVLNLDYMSRLELEDSLNFSLDDKFLIVTYHPITLSVHSAEQQILDLLAELKPYLDEYKVIFTLPNSDTDGRIIMQHIVDFVSKNAERAAVYTSLGLRRYLSALRYATAVVGNSSSGIIEVPSFGIPTLDIGDRQKGRTSALSVLHVASQRINIREGLKTILSEDFLEQSKSVENPYHKNGTAMAISSCLQKIPLKQLIQKSFFDIKL